MSDNTELAQNRTDWSEDRTILANERTFAGWMRTGMASLALAVGLKAVFGDFEPTYAAKLLASVFVAIAIFIFWAAQRSAAKTQKRLDDHHANAQPIWWMRFLASIFAIAAIGVGAVLWAL